MLRELLAESSEEDVRAHGSTQAILADLGIKKHSNEEIAVLQSVLTEPPVFDEAPPVWPCD